MSAMLFTNRRTVTRTKREAYRDLHAQLAKECKVVPWWV